MIINTLSIFFTWAVFAIALLGVGLLVTNCFSINIKNSETLLSSLCIGWCTLIIMLQIWHLFLPVDIYTVVCFLFIGFLGAIINKNNCCYIYYILTSNKGKIALTAIIVFAFWLSNQVMRDNKLYDSGLYHLNMIQWISTYPIIPGLGNLHGRFAYNNSFFLYLSFLDSGYWHHYSTHLGNGFLLLIMSFYICLSFFKISQKSNARGVFIFILLLAYPILERCRDACATTSTDLPVFVFTIIVSYQLFLIIFDNTDLKLIQYRVFLVILLSVICVTIKLSFIAFGFTASLISTIIVLKKMHERQQIKYLKNTAILTVFTILLIVCPWMVRGIYLSGYIAYPSTVGAINVDWRVPIDNVVKENRSIKSWARQPSIDPDIVLSDWQWLKPWANRMKDNKYVKTTLFLIIIGFILTFISKCNTKYRLLFYIWFLPGIMSLFFWFFTAPDPRFAMGFFWMLAAGALTSSLQCWQLDNKHRTITIIQIITLLIVIRSMIMAHSNTVIIPNKIAQVENFQTQSGLMYLFL